MNDFNRELPTAATPPSLPARLWQQARNAPRWAVISLVSLLVLANTFNIAADLAAMGEALSLVIGGLKLR